MNEPVTLPAPVLPEPPPPTKWERERSAFVRLLPELLQTHRGKYVAIHEGRVVGQGQDKLALAEEAYEKYGYVPIYVTLVIEPSERPVVRMPSFRVAQEGGR